jgi:hypothetical protein
MKNRTRLVNFRVTEEEYAQLRNASMSQGIRCLSDFARNALFESASLQLPGPRIRPSGPGTFALQAHLLVFDQRISTLEASMDRMAAAVQRLAEGVSQIRPHTAEERT